MTGLRWTPEQYADHLRRHGVPAPCEHINTRSPPFMLPPDVEPSTRPRRGVMNKTERAYADLLNQLQADGAIEWWAFESMKLRLASNTFYTPDFTVKRNGALEFFEVKGFWRDDARVKIKVAAEMYPFRFVAVQRFNGAWRQEEIGR